MLFIRREVLSGSRNQASNYGCKPCRNTLYQQQPNKPNRKWGGWEITGYWLLYKTPNKKHVCLVLLPALGNCEQF